MKNQFNLTNREIQLLQMFSEGKTSEECAKELHLSYFKLKHIEKTFTINLVHIKLLTLIDTTITVSLKPEEKILQQVTVISTRSNNCITDEPQRVEILGQEEVKA